MRFLFVDRILDLSPGKAVKGIKHIRHDEAYLCPDEQGRPCFIPSLIGETLGQLAAWNVMALNNFTYRPVAGIVASARLHRPAYVGETLALESTIERLDDQAVQYNSVAKVNHEIIFTVEGALGPLLPMDDFIVPDTVRQQFQDINHPSDWTEALKQLETSSYEIAAKDNHAYTMPMLYDQILSIEPGASIIAEKTISRSAAFFDDHFPKKPVLPMTVLLECNLNLARTFIKASNISQHYQFSELRRIKMNDFVHPGDKLVCHAKMKQQSDAELIVSFRCEVDGKRVCVSEAVFIARG